MANAAEDRKGLTPETINVVSEAAWQMARTKQEAFEGELWTNCLYGVMESPIEQMFYCGIHAIASINSFALAEKAGVKFNLERFRETDLPSMRTGNIYFFPQMKIGPYRADFVVHAVDGPQHCPVVVELDGHHWHERTEAERCREKKRDRYMQYLGLRVARYTGSEVFKDPFRTAADALNLSVGSDNYFITAADYWGD